MENRLARKTFLVITIFSIILFLILQGTVSGNQLTPDFPIVGDPPQKVSDRFIPEPEGYIIEIWVENLRIPWELVFLSEKKALVTERAGLVRLIENGILQENPYKVIAEVEHIGEGGLMGLAKHPDYPDQKYLYVMYTYRENNAIFNRVARYYDTGRSMEFDRFIINNIPGSRVHNGGRMAFGPDGMLYICTGDTWQAEIAQDINHLGGKILRLTPDGDIPLDNPFPNSPVYSLGHRNPQGLAWHPETDTLFSSEHGPSGEFGLYNKDIINVIEKGGNYGWPLVLGDANIDQYIDPIIMWTQATPPSGMSFWNGHLFVATLGSQTLIRIGLALSGDLYEVKYIDRLLALDWSSGTYGRLRDVVVGPDNALYVLTNNHDGRGRPQEGDDKILRLILKLR
jgi:quinoprotein glucose dehydrogenase